MKSTISRPECGRRKCFGFKNHFKLFICLVPVFRTIQMECTLHAVGSHGNFTSPGYPMYMPSTYRECQWDITSLFGENILLTFTDVDLPEPGSRGICHAAFLTWGSFDYRGRRVTEGRVCGSDAPVHFRTTTERAWVNLVITGSSEEQIYLKHRGLHFTYESTYSELRMNHLIVGIIFCVTIPAVCCTPIIWYYAKKNKSRSNDLARVIAREKFYRKRLVKKVLSQSQQIMENSGLDARSKFYGVSAYICQDSDTTFESVEAEKKKQGNLQVLENRKKVEAMLSAIEEKQSKKADDPEKRSLSWDPPLDPRCTIYEMKPEDLSPITADGASNEISRFQSRCPKIRTSSKIPHRVPDMNMNYYDDREGFSSFELSKDGADECYGEDSVFRPSENRVSFKLPSKIRFARHKMSLAFSAPSMESISEMEEFKELKKTENGASNDVPWSGQVEDSNMMTDLDDDSVFVGKETPKCVRFAEETTNLIISDGESYSSEDAKLPLGSDRKVTNLGDEDSDDAIFFDAKSSTGSLAIDNEMYVDDSASYSFESPHEPNSETESIEHGII